MHLDQFFCMKLISNKIDVVFFTHGFLDASISKMFEGTNNDIQVLEVFVRVASEK